MIRQCNLCQRAARPNWAVCDAHALRLLAPVDDRPLSVIRSQYEELRAEVSPTSRGGQRPSPRVSLLTAGRPSASVAASPRRSGRPTPTPADSRLRAAATKGR